LKPLGEWDTGDVVGCGYIFHRREIFFTKNGELLGIMCEVTIDAPLYPTFGLDGQSTDFSVNFGKEPFEFDIVQFEREVSSELPVKPFSILFLEDSSNQKMEYVCPIEYELCLTILFEGENVVNYSDRLTSFQVLILLAQYVLYNSSLKKQNSIEAFQYCLKTQNIQIPSNSTLELEFQEHVHNIQSLETNLAIVAIQKRIIEWASRKEFPRESPEHIKLLICLGVASMYQFQNRNDLHPMLTYSISYLQSFHPGPLLETLSLYCRGKWIEMIPNLKEKKELEPVKIDTSMILYYFNVLQVENRPEVLCSLLLECQVLFRHVIDYSRDLKSNKTQMTSKLAELILKSQPLSKIKKQTKSYSRQQLVSLTLGGAAILGGAFFLFKSLPKIRISLV